MRVLLFAFCIGLVNGYTVPNQSYQGSQFYHRTQYQEYSDQQLDPFLQNSETQYYQYQQTTGQADKDGFSNPIFNYVQNSPGFTNQIFDYVQNNPGFTNQLFNYVQNNPGFTNQMFNYVQNNHGFTNQMFNYVQNNPVFTNQNIQRDQLTSYQQPQFERQNPYNAEQQNGWSEEGSFQSRINDQGDRSNDQEDRTNDQSEDFTFGEPERPKRRSMYKTMKKWGYYLYVVWPLLTGWGIIG